MVMLFINTHCPESQDGDVVSIEGSLHQAVSKFMKNLVL